MLFREQLTPIYDPYWHGVLISFLSIVVMALVSKRSLDEYESVLLESHGPIITDEFHTGAPVARRLDGRRIVEAAIRGGGASPTRPMARPPSQYSRMMGPSTFS